MIDSSGYRKNVGIILVNSSSELLICKRFKEQSWQFPQGGFKKNETAESAMYRELYEEVWQFSNGLRSVGVKKGDRVRILNKNSSYSIIISIYE